MKRDGCVKSGAEARTRTASYLRNAWLCVSELLLVAVREQCPNKSNHIRLHVNIGLACDERCDAHGANALRIGKIAP